MITIKSPCDMIHWCLSKAQSIELEGIIVNKWEKEEEEEESVSVFEKIIKLYLHQQFSMIAKKKEDYMNT
jgi:dethiobiotin synthetase